ncbi:hypothetical protein FNV43_RR24483 [Rhamnella rubrinervis]|uniref:RING-type E3 ubiquitin transferase n=1 Tax=Rhamnella rubrinervis TaxID=2594499 RepID=A0A8K0DRA0_9ROSA|nr:hypothetical protein FNV43_RR24483 [Rhamnella rubrinervis]
MDHDSKKFSWHYSDSLDDHNFQIRGRTLFFIIVLFAFILLVTIIILYARWACRHPLMGLNRNSHFGDGATPPKSQGLAPEAIKGLPIVLHKSLTSTLGGSGGGCDAEHVRAECCICLGVFEDGDKVKVLPPCKHSYHPHCVDKWLANHSSCPLCRASLQGKPNDALQIVVQ